MAQIVLVENDESLRRYLVRELRRAGHAVADYASGDAALADFHAGCFALLITDSNLPGTDGIKLAKMATALDPSLRIMFITGFSALVLQPAGERAENYAGLSKPFHLREIAGKIDRLLAA